jgi:hypothetical protein
MSRLSIAFLHVGADLALPSLMVASARAAMPGAEIVQMTDRDTAAVPGVDTVARRDWDGTKLMIFRLAHLAALDRAACVLLDTDVVVQRPLDHVFEQPFDVALTIRHERIKDLDGVNIVERMPYNTGVMFSRRPQFWAQALEHCRQLTDDLHDWYGDQVSVKHVADSGAFKVVELPCDPYNHTPRIEQEDVRDCYVVHYKGARKEWMKRRFERQAPHPPQSRRRGILMQVLHDIFRRR